MGVFQLTQGRGRGSDSSSLGVRCVEREGTQCGLIVGKLSSFPGEGRETKNGVTDMDTVYYCAPEKGA